jgi:hypothetical protein
MDSYGNYKMISTRWKNLRRCAYPMREENIFGKNVKLLAIRLKGESN